MDVLETQIFNTLNPDQQIRYGNNRVVARARLNDFLNGCRDSYTDNNTGNAFLHAYWTALNASSFGPELALKLVSAHEAHGNNPISEAVMDHYNDMVGLAIQRYHPNASQEQLANLVLSSITTGHGKRLVDGVLQRTSSSLCD